MLSFKWNLLKTKVILCQHFAFAFLFFFGFSSSSSSSLGSGCLLFSLFFFSFGSYSSSVSLEAPCFTPFSSIHHPSSLYYSIYLLKTSFIFLAFSTYNYFSSSSNSLHLAPNNFIIPPCCLICESVPNTSSFFGLISRQNNK